SADHVRAELVRAEGGQFAHEPAKRRAGGGKDDDGIGACGHHGFSCSGCYMTIVIYSGIATGRRRFPQTRRCLTDHRGRWRKLKPDPRIHGADRALFPPKLFGRVPGHRCAVSAPLAVRKHHPGAGFSLGTASPQRIVAGAMTRGTREAKTAQYVLFRGPLLGRISTNDLVSTRTR